MILRTAEPIPSAPMIKSCWAVWPFEKVMVPDSRSIALHYIGMNQYNDRHIPGNTATLTA